MPRISGSGNAGQSTESGLIFTEKTPYNEHTFVVVNTISDIYADADRTSTRLTQLLFDEPVQIPEPSDNWVRLNVDDRIGGWMRAECVDGDWTCVDRRRYIGRIIITDKEKQVYSSPRNGIIIRDVGMGTELFVVAKSDNVYQVALPGNLTGWVSETGAFQLDVDEAIKRTNADIFAQTISKFRGTTYLHGGISFQGIDGAGMLYISAKVNGVQLPRDFDGQYAAGDIVEGGLDELVIGDALFFSMSAQSGEVGDAGVYTGESQFIHANQHTGKVQYEDIGDPYFQQRILGVRRYF